MDKLIDFSSYPVRSVLHLLLQDRSTKKNIIWATDPPEELSSDVTDKSQITEEQLIKAEKNIIQPRMMKISEIQSERTRKKGEVFTPAWICNFMNNQWDEEWFYKKDVFNTPNNDGQGWTVVQAPIEFSKQLNWKYYVDSRHLEIACGEAPYLASRYDVSTGEFIPICKRIGILDRKIRIVNENTSDYEEWHQWILRAFQSVYGYEYQGDSLLIARVNLLMTFMEYYTERWQKEPEQEEIQEIVDIIVWNLWQMDGLQNTVPLGRPYQEIQQPGLFDIFEFEPRQQESEAESIPCKIYNWRRHHPLLFSRLHREEKKDMKFDFIIGNPPYQETMEGTSDKPVYNEFMDAAFKIADKVELITPARFLFNAGKTPKSWNQKMLSDKHFKVQYYEKNSAAIFPNTDIKGGVVITYRDTSQDFGPIGTFTVYDELNSILHKVIHRKEFTGFNQLIYAPESYRLSKNLHEENPDVSVHLSKGHLYDVTTNIFDRLDFLFFKDCPGKSESYIQMLGRKNNQRAIMWVQEKYIDPHPNLMKYKVFLPKSNGSGAFGETLSSPMIGMPRTGHTQSFISIGAFESEFQSNAALKYIKTRFARTLLSSLKVTQDNKKAAWANIPLQDFTPNSDIDWSGSVAEIDRQLYRKYNLSDNEIAFIETKVKEMI